MFLFHGNLDTLYNCSLALRGDLLCALERDERELEVVRCLLKSILLSRLMIKLKPGITTTRERSTNEIELKRSKLLEIC